METLNNRPLFLIFAGAKRHFGAYHQSLEKLQAAKIERASSAGAVSAFTWLFNGLRLTAMLYVGIVFLSLPVGSLIALYTLSSFLSGSLNDMTALWIEIRKADAAIQRIHDFLERPVEVVKDVSLRYPKTDVAIQMQGVGFSFPGKEIFRDMDLTLHSNQAIGIVGDVGTGKTTLFQILQGFAKPKAGKIAIMGVEQTPDTCVALRDCMSFVDQNCTMLDGSIQEIITNYAESIDEEWLQNCIERAQLAPFIRSLEQGLQSTVGFLGESVSGGQAQRIAIARALYKRAPILLLDEPTAALDVQIEKDIIQTLVSLKQDHCILIISHRYTSVQWTDSVLCLSNGRLEKAIEEKVG